MVTLPRLAHARKLNPLPLFQWAEENQQRVCGLLLITSKLASQTSISQ